MNEGPVPIWRSMIMQGVPLYHIFKQVSDHLEAISNYSSWTPSELVQIGYQRAFHQNLQVVVEFMRERSVDMEDILHLRVNNIPCEVLSSLNEVMASVNEAAT